MYADNKQIENENSNLAQSIDIESRAWIVIILMMVISLKMQPDDTSFRTSVKHALFITALFFMIALLSMKKLVPSLYGASNETNMLAEEPENQTVLTKKTQIPVSRSITFKKQKANHKMGKKNRTIFSRISSTLFSLVTGLFAASKTKTTIVATEVLSNEEGVHSLNECTSEPKTKSATRNQRRKKK